MLSDSDKNWFQAAANDLNNLLQVIAESSKAIEPICDTRPEGRRYFAFLQTSLDRAKQVTAQLAERLGGEPFTPTSVKGAPAQAVERKRPPAYVIDNPSGSKGLILIIDDEELLVTLVKQMLTDAGYRVVAAIEPFLALDIYKELKEQVDLVILDYTLPIMDGSEVFDALRSIKSDVAVMLSSGFAEQDKVRAMLSKGLRGFLPKPYTEEKLLSQVRLTLEAIRGMPGR